MLVQLLAIARNTFFESIRQPIVLVLLVVATLLVVLSIPFSAFTMQDDQRMFLDIGLSTVFVMGTLLAAFIATNVVNREIENGTALTVISKPVGRVPFVLGKYMGVSCAILLAMAYLSLVFVLVERHGTMQTVRTPYHLPVLLFGLGTLIVAVATGAWCNYFYGKVFGSTVLLAAVPMLAIGYVLSLFFKPDFSGDVFMRALRVDIWTAILAMTMAILIITAVAVAASTRLGQVMTVAVTLGVFMLGMLSDWLFGRPADRLEKEFDLAGNSIGFFAPDHLLFLLCKGLYAVVPNFQFFWLSDALTQQRPIPASYILTLLPYGALQIVVVMSLAVILFQRREVG